MTVDSDPPEQGDLFGAEIQTGAGRARFRMRLRARLQSAGLIEPRLSEMERDALRQAELGLAPARVDEALDHYEAEARRLAASAAPAPYQQAAAPPPIMRERLRAIAMLAGIFGLLLAVGWLDSLPMMRTLERRVVLLFDLVLGLVLGPVLAIGATVSWIRALRSDRRDPGEVWIVLPLAVALGLFLFWNFGIGR